MSAHLPAGHAIGDWVLEEVLGSGATGTVYRARAGRRTCALKVLHRQSVTDATRARFLHEFSLLADLKHPRLAGILDRVDAGGELAIASELVAGQTLEQLLGNQGTGLEPAVVRQLLLDICEGLEFLHGHSILHRDLKPSNVITGKDGRARLLDFGLSRLMGEETIATDPKRVKVSLAYTAPEIILRKPTGPATDLYSLGHLTYQLLTGKPAFGRKSLAALATAQISEPAPAPSCARPLCHWWDEIAAKLLAKDPSDRYPSAKRLAEDLTALRSELS